MPEKTEGSSIGNCQECGAYTFNILGGKPPPTYCADCRALLNHDDSNSHPKRVRCPVCKHLQEANPDGEWRIEDDGKEEVTCEVCGVEYEVLCRLNVTWSSPAVTGRNPDPGSAEEWEKEGDQ